MNRKKEILNVFLLCAVVFLGSGLINLLYQKKSYVEEIETLKSRLNIIEEDLIKSNEQLNKMDLFRYKNEILNKKYPLFSKIIETVFKKSIKYGFDPNLIMGLIQIESDFKQYAVSSRGAFGLMQINYSVWKNELNIDFRKIFKIEYNIDLGLKILRRYYKRSRGDILKTLHLYNNGFLHNNDNYKYKVISTVFY